MEPPFLQFPPADKAAWRAQVQKDLKDEAAPDRLRWETDLGNRAGAITLEPYYTAEDRSPLPIKAIQAAQKQVPGWLNTPELRVTDPKPDNSLARTALARGADALVLELNNPLTGGDISWLLNGIKLSDTPVFFRSGNLPATFIKHLQTVAPYQPKGGLLTDPLATWQHTGRLPHDSLTALGDATTATADSPQFRTICASGHVYHNAGATATQELAFLLGSLADQYDTLTDAGLTVGQLMPKTVLSVSVGTSYFVEIAKLRALRVLWFRFVSACQTMQNLPALSPFIHAQTSVFYSAALSPYTNLLRGTTEAMAAVIGGCDALTVYPYNAVPEMLATETDREFASRIARNVSILLAEESYLDKVADPSAGSYYIETLTHNVAEAAWTLFLRVEAMGGLQKAVTSGFVQAEIEHAYQAKVDALNNGRVMVGVNKFREAGSLPATPVSVPFGSVPQSAGMLPSRRLAEMFEK